MNKFTIQGKCAMFFFALSVLSACQKDPYEGVSSHERAIEKFQIPGQIGPAVVDRVTKKVQVSAVLQGVDLTKVAPKIQTSYHALVSPASGEMVNFSNGNRQLTYTVTAESGQATQWTVEIVPFVEALEGTYDVKALTIYGGTGPEYGGAAVMKLSDKPWVWPTDVGPAAEEDNSLTFTLQGLNEKGNTFGTVTNNAGADGKYADFLFIGDPQTDVNHFYRQIPKGEGKWERDYINKTITFTAADGSKTVASFLEAGTLDLGNGTSKAISDQAFGFALTGTDDWDKIYTDYDKFVKKPRNFWIEVKKR